MSWPYTMTYTPSAGDTILAAHLTTSNTEHINNNIPESIDDYSANDTEFETVADPYPGSANSKPTVLSGEFTRIRYQILELAKKWDSTASKWQHDIGSAPVLGTPASGDISNCTGGPTLTSVVLNTGISGDIVLDDDSMATATNTSIATSESIKAYVDAQSSGSSPSGSVSAYTGAAAPTGWLLCDGTTGKDSVADTTLAALYAVIGTTYGGTGADDFDLPDLRGRMIVMIDGAAGRITTETAESLNDSGGGSGKLVAHNHSHNHGQQIRNNGTAGNLGTQGSSIGDFETAGVTDTDATSAGSGTSSMNPFLTLNYIIAK